MIRIWNFILVQSRGYVSWTFIIRFSVIGIYYLKEFNSYVSSNVKQILEVLLKSSLVTRGNRNQTVWNFDKVSDRYYDKGYSSFVANSVGRL
ncbi:hypothetical protein J6590_036312 [Homalodisca vitripennis]|nr:hypothetical protein J6590_036312 [Homalodisca vitripennis]